MSNGQPNSRTKWRLLLLILLLLIAAGCWWTYSRSKTPGSVRLSMNNGVTIWRWRLVEDGHPDHEVQWQDAARAVMNVLPGKYRVQVKESSDEGDWVMWPQVIQVRPRQQTTFTVDTALQLNLPQNLGTPWRWRVVHPDTPGQVIQWRGGDHRAMLLAPGEYQLQLRESSDEGDWVAWPQKIQIQPGQHAAITIDSGLQLNVPQALGTPWRWRVIAPDNPGQVIHWRTGDHRSMILPPAQYQVEVRQSSSEGDWVRWPDPIQVQPNQQATATIDSAIRLSVPASQPASRWSVSATTAPDKTIQWLYGNNRLMLLPPGTYQVQIQQDNGDRHVVSHNITLSRGQIAETVPSS
jgi:hypothetical protein